MIQVCSFWQLHWIFLINYVFFYVLNSKISSIFHHHVHYCCKIYRTMLKIILQAPNYIFSFLILHTVDVLSHKMLCESWQQLMCVCNFFCSFLKLLQVYICISFEFHSQKSLGIIIRYSFFYSRIVYQITKEKKEILLLIKLKT